MPVIKRLSCAFCVVVLFGLSHIAADDDKVEVPGDGGQRTESDSDKDATETLSGADAEVHDKVEDAGSLAALHLYRHLLRHKRAAHMEAVKKIISLNSAEKQQQMLKAIFAKMFAVFVQAKLHLTEHSFTPGDPFPTENGIKDAFSTILENTAFLGDIILRLPDISHKLLDSNSEWKLLTRWAVDFTNDSHVFTGTDDRVINMMAQELEIIEKDPNFINPFKMETKVEQIIDRELEKVLAEKKRKQLKQQKKEEKKKSRGPRMSAPGRTEL